MMRKRFEEDSRAKMIRLFNKNSPTSWKQKNGFISYVIQIAKSDFKRSAKKHLFLNFDDDDV
jgi:hypothetical protein